MSRFQRICVFCGSQPGKDPQYLEVARSLGKSLAERGIDVVYGGAQVGCMGAVADSALDHGAKVYGVIPHRLQSKEIAHARLTELYRVESMHQRKSLMGQLCQGFVVLPGGWGTLEEMFEVLTWTQLGYHRKPLGIINVNGYYDSLINFADHANQQGFLRDEHRACLISRPNVDSLLDALEEVELPETAKWLDNP